MDPNENFSVPVRTASGEVKLIPGLSSKDDLLRLREKIVEIFKIPSQELALYLGGKQLGANLAYSTLQTLGIAEGVELSCVRSHLYDAVDGAIIAELRGDLLYIISTGETKELTFKGLCCCPAYEMYSGSQYASTPGFKKIKDQICSEATALLSGKKVYFVAELVTPSGVGMCETILGAMKKADKTAWHLIAVCPSSPACVPLLLGGANGAFAAILNFQYGVGNIQGESNAHPYTLVDAAYWYSMGPSVASTVIATIPHRVASCYQHPPSEMLDLLRKSLGNRYYNDYMRVGFHWFLQYSGMEECHINEARGWLDNEIKHMEKEGDQMGQVGDNVQRRSDPNCFVNMYGGPNLKSVHLVPFGLQAQDLASKITGSGTSVAVHPPTKMKEGAIMIKNVYEEHVVVIISGDVIPWSWEGESVLESFREKNPDLPVYALFITQGLEAPLKFLVWKQISCIIENVDLCILVRRMDDAASFMNEIMCTPSFRVREVMIHLVPFPRFKFVNLYRGKKAVRHDKLIASYSWGVSPSGLAISARDSVAELCEYDEEKWEGWRLRKWYGTWNGVTGQVFGEPMPPTAKHPYTLSMDKDVSRTFTRWTGAATSEDVIDSEVFGNCNNLQEVLRAFFSACSEGTNQDKALAAFKKFDANGDGTITEGELKSALLKLGMSEKEIAVSFQQADANTDGIIDYEEFIAWVYADPHEAITEMVSKASGES